LIVICQFSFVLQVLLLLAMVCSNVGSLPLYLAASLPLPKPDVFSYLTIYIAAQSLFMWGLYYPCAVFYLQRQCREKEQACVDEESATELSSLAAGEGVPAVSLARTPTLTAREILVRNFSPCKGSETFLCRY
jgi:hypothetical protein